MENMNVLRLFRVQKTARNGGAFRADGGGKAGLATDQVGFPVGGGAEWKGSSILER